MEGSGVSPSDDEPFEVSDSPDSVVSEQTWESANVCRAAALSSMLGGDPAAVRGLRTELSQLGFARELIGAEDPLGSSDPREAFANVWGTEDPRQDEARIRRWRGLNDAPWAGAAVAFLVSFLGSRLERESATAASALWRLVSGLEPERYWRDDQLRNVAVGYYPLAASLSDGEPELFPWSGLAEGAQSLFTDEPLAWDPEGWSSTFEQVRSVGGDAATNFYLVSLLARWRVARALRSRDSVTKSLAAAAFLPTDPREPLRPSGSSRESAVSLPLGPQTEDSAQPGHERASAMIHGTWAWNEEWWRLQPLTFHEFIRDEHRANLYGRGGRFSWSGRYNDDDRELAGRDFAAWISDLAPTGLRSVFAHSYGGEVAARAVLHGANISELVLLSVPATRFVQEAALTRVRVVDFRLWLDPVLVLARTPQRIHRGQDLKVILLRSIDHGATHEESVWRRRNIARRAGI